MIGARAARDHKRHLSVREFGQDDKLALVAF